MNKLLYLRVIFTVFLLSLSLQIPAQELPGVPVFGDDFNVHGLFAENWESTKAAKIEEGQAVIPAGNNMKLRRIPEGDFAFTADLTVEKPEGKLGHSGVILDGIHFMITPKDPPPAQTAYRVPGEKRSRGSIVKEIPGLKLGAPCRIYVSREQLGDGYKYLYKVNGQAVDSFQAILPADGEIKFYGYRTEMKVDNFQLYALKEGNESNNLAINSSFEYLQEGMPNYMRPHLGGQYKFDGKWEDFLKCFSIDVNEKVSGKQSVRMTCGKNGPESNGVGTHNVSIMAKTPVTFSVYLKASEDHFPVTMGIWELHSKLHKKMIKISKQWKRYSFTVDDPKRAKVRGSVKFDTPGTVWADDFQIEVGSEATKYAPSSLDQDKYRTATHNRTRIEKDIGLKMTHTAPVIDGNLEDLWFENENAVKVDKFFCKGSETPENKTEAYLSYDKENLYLAVRAYVPDTSKVKGSKFPHDTLKAHSEDCIEVFLDTSFGRKDYYHLTSNAAGSTTDMGPGRRLAWNGDWEAATKINQATRSIDYEIKFPLRLFTGLDLSQKWGINIGRHDTDRNKVYSLTHGNIPSFHVPEIYPALVFPEGILDAFKLGFRNLSLASADDSRKVVVGDVSNLSGKTLSSEIQIFDNATGDLLRKQKLDLEGGNTEIQIPVDMALDANVLDCTVKLFVDGNEYLTHSQRLNIVRKLEFYPRYNYYMNEDVAVLVGTLGLSDADKLTGRVTVAGQTFDVKMQAEFALEVPLKELPNGEHQITLDVYKETEKLVSGSAILVKRAFQEGATQIDRQRRCLVVDGKPSLVIAPFFGVPRGVSAEEQDEVLKNMLRLHKEMGYKNLLVGAVASERKLAQKFITLCEEEDVKIIFWPFGAWKRRDLMTPQQRLDELEGDNIISYLLIDEPELYAKSEEVEAFLEEHRKISPYTPIIMNNTILGIPARFAGLKTDVLGLDDYLCNRENRKVIEMIDGAEMMWEAGQEKRKPTFFFLSGENLHNHYRECTYEEQVAQTYGVVISGVRMVSYFRSLSFYPENYRALVDVNRELTELSPAIMSVEQTSKARINNAVVKFLTRRLGDKIYVIALNSSNERSTDVEIHLPAEFKYNSELTVLFENRTLKHKGGKFFDKFNALERHVYCIEISDR